MCSSPIFFWGTTALLACVTQLYSIKTRGSLISTRHSLFLLYFLGKVKKPGMVLKDKQLTAIPRQHVHNGKNVLHSHMANLLWGLTVCIHASYPLLERQKWCIAVTDRFGNHGSPWCSCTLQLYIHFTYLNELLFHLTYLNELYRDVMKMHDQWIPGTPLPLSSEVSRSWVTVFP